MTEQLPLNFGSVTAPRFEDNPVRYAIWVLEHHADIYREFRRLADEALAFNPERRLSSDQLCHVIRWNTGLRAEGDIAKINNNATSLFARLYIEERPQHKDAFTTRRSVWDSLTVEENERVLLAFETVRMKRWR